MRCNIIREPSSGGVKTGTVVGETYDTTKSKINIPISPSTKVVYFTQDEKAFRRAMVIRGQTGAMVKDGSSEYGLSLTWTDNNLLVANASSLMLATWLYAVFE